MNNIAKLMTDLEDQRMDNMHAARRVRTLEAEVAWLQFKMALSNAPHLDPSMFKGVKNYTFRYEDIDKKNALDTDSDIEESF